MEPDGRDDTWQQPRVCVLGSAMNTTNVDMVRAWREAGVDAALRSPLDTPSSGSIVIGRLDVLPTLDGVEPGLLALLLLGRRGLRVLNRAEALLAVHDKLLTARHLGRAGLPHPETSVWRGERDVPLEPPLVVKPRFGSWGRDVLLCRDAADVSRMREAVHERPWFRRHGALVQEFVQPRGYDLRLIVAGGGVVGAGKRVAARGEWRTNVALGGRVSRVEPSAAARSLAIAAASAVGADFVGVDLLPLGEDGYAIIELNGAVEFDDGYSLSDRGIHLDVAAALDLPRAVRRPLIRPAESVARSRSGSGAARPGRPAREGGS